MDARELRIGNYVYVDWVDAGRKLEINHGVHYGIETMVMNVTPTGYGVAISLVNPIPLTEEWLVKFGFENIGKISGCLAFEKCKIKILHDTRNDQDIYSVCISTVSPATWAICEIQYVHQLQNLYFAITMEELTIK